MAPSPLEQFIQVWDDDIKHGTVTNGPAIAFFSMTVIAYVTFALLGCCLLAAFSEHNKILKAMGTRTDAPTQLPQEDLEAMAMAPPYSAEPSMQQSRSFESTGREGIGGRLP